jgi:hypothetical protein
VIFDIFVQQMFQDSHHGDSSFQIKDLHCEEHLSMGRQTMDMLQRLVQSIRNKVKRVKENPSTSSAHPERLPAGESGPFTLQIWQEAPRVRDRASSPHCGQHLIGPKQTVEVTSPLSAVASSKESSIREPRETRATVEATMFRIVVFYSREIMVIPCEAFFGTRTRGTIRLTSGGTVAKAWREEKHEPETPTSSFTLVPTRPRLQRYMIASLFRSSFSNCLAGIPFDQARFREAEIEFRVDFDSVIIEFRSQRGEPARRSSWIACSDVFLEHDSFERVYRRLKADWLKEQDAQGMI